MIEALAAALGVPVGDPTGVVGAIALAIWWIAYAATRRG